MASFGLLGALRGASGQALDAMKARDDEERELRKTRMLAELQRDTAIYLADYEAQLKDKEVDDKQSRFDPTTGEYVMRNRKGEELSRRADKGMAEEYEVGKQKDQLQLDVARANIRQSDASAAASAAQAARTRQGTSLDKQQADAVLNKGTSISERASELMFQNKTVVEDLVNSGVPAEVVNQTAQELYARAAATGSSPSAVPAQFNRAMAFLREKYKSKETSTNSTKVKKSLDDI